jgi:hypothetical protein
VPERHPPLDAFRQFVTFDPTARQRAWAKPAFTPCLLDVRERLPVTPGAPPFARLSVGMREDVVAPHLVVQEMKTPGRRLLVHRGKAQVDANRIVRHRSFRSDALSFFASERMRFSVSSLDVRGLDGTHVVGTDCVARAFIRLAWIQSRLSAIRVRFI